LAKPLGMNPTAKSEMGRAETSRSKRSIVIGGSFLNVPWSGSGGVSVANYNARQTCRQYQSVYFGWWLLRASTDSPNGSRAFSPPV